MSMSSHLIQRGTALWKSGQKTEARKIFETVVHNDCTNEAAWVWYIHTLETNPEKIAALKRFLEIFPGHETAQKALTSLEQSSHPQPPLEDQEMVPEKKTVPAQEVRPVQKTSSSPLPWILVLLGLCLFVFSSVAYMTGYKSLQHRYNNLAAEKELMLQDLVQWKGKYATLQSQHSDLTNQYDSLTGQYNSLNNEYASLQGQYNDLNNEYSVLGGKYDTLSTQYATLNDSYNILQSNYNSTVDSFSAFREVAIAPPYIYTRQRQVHLVFIKRDGSLIHWTIGSDWLEHHLRLGDEERAHLTYSLSLYNKFTDETYHVVDDRKFVDATPFTNLMTDLYRQSPNDYAFIQEVWNIVAQLTAYADEYNETPRFPMETLLSGGGDCEDHAILFASMILASPVPWEVTFIYMDGEHPTEPQDMNHVIVQVDTGNGAYLVEATSKDSMNPYSDGVYGWSYTINQDD